MHHLGDDDFSGRINSQFQRDAEGSDITMTFNIPPSMRTDLGRLSNDDQEVTLTMMVKGVQLSHRLYINNRRLSERLEDSPSNGSFGEFRVSFPADYLKVGSNQFEIKATSRGSDVDDFEFVNVKVELLPAGGAD